MKGQSLVPFARDSPTDWRTEWLYDYYEYPGAEDVRPHRGIRTQSEKLMHFYTVNEWEMYDLANDPEEKVNLYGNARHGALQQKLTQALKRLAAAVPDTPGPYT